MERQVNHEANKNLILQQLIPGRRITCLSVLKTVGTLETRHFIAILRKTVRISDVWVSNGKVRYKEYYIEDVTGRKQGNQ